jgi:hypothetical protein
MEDAKKTEENKEIARGERGEVGTATAKLTLVQLWHNAHFTRRNAEEKRNPNKHVWVANQGAPSLKQFAREQAKSGNKVAKDWFANKKGAKNEKRSEKNQARVTLERQASKAARRKASQGKAAKSATAAAPAAVK